MTRRATRALHGRATLRLEPLEDRLLLAAGHAAPVAPANEPSHHQADSSDDDDSKYPQQQTPPPVPAAPSGAQPGPDPVVYQYLPDGTYYFTAAEIAAVALATPKRELPAAPTTPPPPPPLAPPVAGGAVPVPTPTAGKEGSGHSPEPPPEANPQAAAATPEAEEPPAGAAVETKPQAAEGDPPPDLPGIAAGGWEQVARRFLGALESLDAVGTDRDSIWVRLGMWSLAAASSVVLYELTRQQVREPRRKGLAPEDRWTR